jgi:hypothetical protein
MKAEQLRNVLQHGRFADGEEALEHVVAATRTAVSPRANAGPRRRQFLTATAALLACLGLVSITPPGRAATQWISDLVSGPNEFQPGQYGYQLKTSTLLGSGELPNGDRYQLRGYVGNGDDGGCVAIVWERSDRSVGTCANVSPAWKADGLSAPVIGRLPGDEKTPGASGVFVLGTAPEGTSDVAIRVPASDGVQATDEPAQLFPIRGSIADTTGASAAVPSVQAFVGYLPPGAGDARSAPPANVVAVNGDTEVGSIELSWIRFQLPDSGEPAIMSCIEGTETCQAMLSATAGTAGK